MRKNLDTRISEVTVYSNQALVRRKGVVQLKELEQELVIAQLPGGILSESVRASIIGTASARLLEVRIERKFTNEPVSLELAPLNEKISQLEEKKRCLHDKLILYNLQRNFVKDLSNQYLERLSSSPNSEPLNLRKIKELLEFVEQQYLAFSNAIAHHDREQKQLEKQLQQLRQKQQELSTCRTYQSYNVIITVEASEFCELGIELSYLVKGASWEPIYDLRLNTSGKKINLSYLAQIKQSTGEDWQDIMLTLATAQPEIGKELPKLPTWYIELHDKDKREQQANSWFQSETVLTRRRPETMPFPGTTPTSEKLIEAGSTELLRAEIVAAELCKQGGILTFEVSGLVNIASDGITHKTSIRQEDYFCSVQYVAWPRLINSAYLQVTINNPLNGVTLLPGKANVFRDNTFLGTTELGKVGLGREFQLNLGLEERLKIERHLTERQIECQVEQQVNKEIYAYQLVVTNLLACSAQLKLIEQLPVSRQEQIQVRLNQTNPPKEKSDKDFVQWSVRLEPHSQQELYYQFTVEYPPQLSIVGLDL
ncbi:MAG: mucoidy inhibitor MuiA family protein [Coleofasciculaceae cyanobacterium]